MDGWFVYPWIANDSHFSDTEPGKVISAKTKSIIEFAESFSFISGFLSFPDSDFALIYEDLFRVFSYWSEISFLFLFL